MQGLAGTFLRSERGTAGAEMALILPVLFALIFTLAEAGNYMWTEHKVVKGVRDGARYAARLSFSNYDCPASAGATQLLPNGAERTAIQNMTRTGRVDGQAQAKVPGWQNGQVNVFYDCNASYASGLYEGAAGAQRVTVTTVVPYGPKVSLLGLLGFDVVNVHVRAQAQAAVGGL